MSSKPGSSTFRCCCCLSTQCYRYTTPGYRHTTTMVWFEFRYFQTGYSRLASGKASGSGNPASELSSCPSARSWVMLSKSHQFPETLSWSVR